MTTPLRFLADENFPAPSVALLRQQQMDVKFIAEIFPAYVDRNVLALAVEEQRILLTFDRDFGELVFFRGTQPPPAIVYFRFEPESATEPGEILLRLLENTTIELAGMMNVVTRTLIRKRPFPPSSG
jgi:predicted nuclease of predicted toxin-antitoxin system